MLEQVLKAERRDRGGAGEPGAAVEPHVAPEGAARARESLTVRPSGNWGELHGLYEPTEDGTPPLITVWMRTVARKQVVAFRTFLRTLLHELCHHLDYELYKFPETFHTEASTSASRTCWRSWQAPSPRQANLALAEKADQPE